MAKKHEDYLREVFEENNAIYTSSELIKKIREKFYDCTPENARKIIETAVKSNIIKSTKPLTLGHNQFAYYNPFSNLSVNDINKLIRHNRPGMYRIMQRLNENLGVISYFEALKLAACPVKKSQSKTNRLYELIKILEEMELVRKESNWGIPYLVSYDIGASAAISLMRDHHYNMQLDCMFIPTFLVWLQRHNIINSNTPIYRNKTTPSTGVVHNNLVWDAIAYTDTTGFYEYIGDKDEEKQTLVALDIKIKNSYTSIDLDGFYDRIQIHRNSVKDKNNRRKILPIVVCNEVDNEAKAKMNRLKFLCFDLGTVFGERIYEIVEKLKIISIPSLFINKEEFNPGYIAGQVETALSALQESGQEANLGNLKGELFERLMYHVIRTIYSRRLCGEIRQGYTINSTNNGKKEGYEYDFLVETDDEFIVFEVKGYKGATYIKMGEFEEKTQKPQKNTVKWFFGLTFPYIKEHLRINPFKKPVKACYITTARFDEEALSTLNKINCSKDKPDELEVYYDGNKLLKLLEEYKLEKEIRILKQYYEVITEGEKRRRKQKIETIKL